MIKEISVSTNSRNELVDITSEVAKIVSEVSSGICVVYCPHTTAGITINESADSDVQTDVLGHLSKLIPESAEFRHSEGNSDSHLKSSLVGCSETIVFSEGKLMLGTWQAIYFAEFDGPRSRKVIIKILEG